MVNVFTGNQLYVSPQEALAATLSSKPETPQDALEHYGKKGMQWGVVNEEDGTASASGTRPVALTKAENHADPDGPNRRNLVKKAALIAGGVALVGGAAYAANKYSKNGATSIPAKHEPEGKGPRQEPTGLIYLARAKNKGLTFHQTGNTPDYFRVFDEMGMNKDLPRGDFFSRDQTTGHIAARIVDALGRKDFAGRPISHDFIIPNNMADGINSIDDVRTKIWPRVEADYQKFWDENEGLKHYDEDGNDLAHHGVKGQKWGVRKRYQELKRSPTEEHHLVTEKGVAVTLHERPVTGLGASIGAVSSRFRTLLEQSKGYDIEVDGKIIGDLAVRDRSKDEMYINWITVNDKYRGQGYASAVMDTAIAHAKETGHTRITLEVPGNAPDARHIYEKRGFRQSGPVEGHSGDMWGGLTPMSYEIPKED